MAVKHDARRPDRGTYRPGNDNAHPYRPRRLIAGAGNYRRSRPQTQGLGAFSTDFAAHIRPLTM